MRPIATLEYPTLPPTLQARRPMLPPLSLTFLGTATSVGLPMIGCDCPTCTSSDPKDNRLRSSVWLQSGPLSWVIDTGPDFRYQCLRAGIRHLDAVLYTHPHTDHVTGFDDLRRFTPRPADSLPIYALPSTLDVLTRMFTFAFDGQHRYPGYFKPAPQPVRGPFPLGPFVVSPLPVEHGSVETIGYLFSRAGAPLLAYIPDVKFLSPQAARAIEGVDTLVLDALRLATHRTHMNVEEALAAAAAARPRQTFLTHFHCEIRHAELSPKLPPPVHLAYDGLTLEIAP
jgi:phosphoribosyl 1,2-cyclic phosphate phosphodiesterase